MSLDDVKDRDDVATREEFFDDVSTDETTAADDQIDVLGLRRHFAGQQSRHSHFAFYEPHGETKLSYWVNWPLSSSWVNKHTVRQGLIVVQHGV